MNRILKKYTDMFANELKQVLSKQNMSQKELSMLTGIDTSAISRYIAGERIPPDDKLTEIEKALNHTFLVDPAYNLGLAIDIHKLIDDSIGKKDRYVSIFIGEHGVTVNVYPITEEVEDESRDIV